MMTSDEYLESMKARKVKCFILEEQVANVSDHPLVVPSRSAVASTYVLAHDPACNRLGTACCHLSGRIVNRFTHIQQCTEDLVNKIKMQRLLGQMTGTCFQRCVGMDAINAISSTTYEMDQELNTNYNQRFLVFLQYVQDKDLVSDGVMTDPKGDRSKRPHEQEDPDVFVHVKERRKDGIVVRGAKLHQTGALNSPEIVVMPSMATREEDKEFPVSFGVPSDTEGIVYILGRQPSDTRKSEPGSMDRGKVHYGGHECFVIFDDVFVPWERVFMCGEYSFAGTLVERFAGYHRQSYGGCKVGGWDVLIGAVATLMDYHGLSNVSHLKEKLLEMIHLNETLYCCGMACSTEGYATNSGTYQFDMMLANACKLNVTSFPYEIARLAEEIAGGLLVTMPSEADFRNPETRYYMEKLLLGAKGINTENRLRMLRLVENLTIGAGAVGYRTESMHGAGPPQAMGIMISRQADLEHRNALARKLAGIGNDDSANA